MFGISDYVKLKETGEQALIIDMDETGYMVKDSAGNAIKVTEKELEETEANYLIPVTLSNCLMMVNMLMQAYRLQT